jgi:tetratricopeptide (TPR) repeat protein
MNIREIEFKRLLRSNDLKAAATALERWVEKSDRPAASVAHWRALLLERQGNYAAATEVLTKVILAREDINELCRIHRADNRLHQSLLEEALQDYDAIIASPSAVVAEVLLGSARFKKAYILARQGRREFDEAIQAVPDGQEDFVVDRILARGDLIKIYESSLKRIV